MDCIDIGPADADIAGIGIITAFAFQAIASFIFSVMLDVFLVNRPKADLDHSASQSGQGLRRLNKVRDELLKIGQDASHIISSSNPIQTIENLYLQVASVRDQARALLQGHLDPQQDFDMPILDNIAEKSPLQEARSIVADILYFCNDTQTLAGISLALTGIIRQGSLSMYQFHLVYDTVNLTSISNCAALASASAIHTSDLLFRVSLMGVFGALYLIFVILFGIRLNQWDYKAPGHCYDARLLALPNDTHPYVDQIYLGITCFYMFGVQILACQLALSRYKVDEAWTGWRRDAMQSILKASNIMLHFYKGIPWSRAENGTLHDGYSLKSGIFFFPSIIWREISANPIFGMALLQLPLHLYFIIRLRLSNELRLTDGSEENTWGFGQVFALVMSSSLLLECIRGYLRYQDILGRLELQNEVLGPSSHEVVEESEPPAQDHQTLEVVEAAEHLMRLPHSAR